MNTRFGLGALFVPLALAGCSDPEVPEQVDNRAPIIAEDPPPPITGGSLLVMDDGRVAVADSDRDRVHVVSISPARVEADSLFEQGAEPGRLIEGSAGLIHVVLRGPGDVVAIDTGDGEVVSRRHACSDPRGLAYHADSGNVFVACVDGTLVTMPEDPEGEVTRAFVEPDLRDIVLEDDMLLISRLRSAEILEVPVSGPPAIGRRQINGFGGAVPTVAWRMIEVEPGHVAMLLQFSSTEVVRIERPETEDPDRPGGGGSPYGGGGFCKPPIVSPGVSTWRNGSIEGTMQMVGPTPAVDVAVDPYGQVAIAVAGAPDGDPDVHFAGEEDFCFEGFGGQIKTPGQPVSLAYLPDGKLVVQSREPGELYVYDENRKHQLTIELSGKSVFDTGHDLYHRATEASIACASCHPEGTDDGFTWNFQDLGPRRTQSPEVGLEGSAPFHWDGDMDTFRTLSNEVYTHRMGGLKQSEERAKAFEQWLFTTKRATPDTQVDDQLASDGKAAFNEFGCANCHGGDRLSTDAQVDIWGKSLQVPSLRRVALRPPYMHDGRAPDLRAAVLDMLDATKPGAGYSSYDVDAITEYLRTR